MPEKAIDLDRLHKLAASMHNPNRNEALNAFNAFLAELAKADEAQFSVEYSLGNISPEDTEEAERELSRLRDELAEAFESTARDETTINQLQEIIDRLHVEMDEVHQALRESQGSPLPPPPPERPPVRSKPRQMKPAPQILPPQPFDWGSDEQFTDELTQTRVVHSAPFSWKTLGAWAYGFAVVFWLAMVCLPGLRNSYSSLFLPLLWVGLGVPGFFYFQKLRESYGWIAIAVKVCLTVELVTLFTVLCLSHRWELPSLTRREEVFAFVVLSGLLWFLYSERFLLWVLDEPKRTQWIVFPGAIVILICLVSWVTATDSRAVKASAPLQQSSQPPHTQKRHPAPKPTPPPDDSPQILNYDFELPPRAPSSPVLLETSYSPATAPPDLIAAAFQTSASSEDHSGGVVLFLVVLVVLKLASGESKQQKQRRYQKALDEANTPLPQNETGNARLASAKELKKRGWA